jgi:peroxiredoxin
MRKLLLGTVLSLSAVAWAAVPELPRPVPDFVINLENKKQIRLSQFRDKTVVLVFILTYCSHCHAVVRGLIKDQQELGAQGLQVVACAIEDMASVKVPGFIRQFAPNFPVGYSDNTEAIRFLQHSPMMAFYMPAVVFIDKTGMIRKQVEGRDPLLEEATQEKAVREEILKLVGTPALSAPRQEAGKKSAPVKKATGKKSQ